MKDRLIDKIINFDLLLGLVAMTIAFVAAFFSVYGIATLFSGAFISVIIMASALELSKLVSVSYLYRYWKQTKWWLCFYLSIALIILMCITSGGIFGYLSAAYQKSATEYKAKKEQIALVESSKTYVSNRIDQAKNRIEMLNNTRKAQEARMSGALTNIFISRNAIQLKQLQDQTADMIKTTEESTKNEQKKIDDAVNELQSIDKKVHEMTFEDNNKDIKTFEFVAKLFDTDLDTVAKWFIFLLIVVFDPLSMALILAYNVVSYNKKINRDYFNEEKNIPDPVIVEYNEEDVKKK